MTRSELGLAAADDTDHAGAPDPGDDLVAAEFPQAIGDDAGGTVHLIQKLRMLVEIMAPGGHVVGEGGDTIDDGHGDTFRQEDWQEIDGRD